MKAELKNKKVTLTIMVILCVVFILDTLTSQQPFSKGYLYNGDNFGLLMEYGRLLHVSEINFQYWRLITCLFLHAGIPHLLLNLIPLYIAGSKLEETIGGFKLLMVFVVSGIGASVAEMLASYGTVGASGAIYGIISCLFISKSFQLKEPFAIPKLIILILYLIVPNLSGTTAIYSHAAGFVVGIYCVPFLKIHTKNTCV